MATKTIKTIADLEPDRRNANKGTVRGRAMLDHSLRTLGAGRSILADKNGRIIAGNKTLEVAADIDLPIEVIKTRGDRLIVVQREDLDLDTDPAARELAFFDNRTSEIGLSWDAAAIAADLEAGLDLAELFDGDELSAILEGLSEPTPPENPPDASEIDALLAKWGVLVGQTWEIKGKAVHRVWCGDSSNQTEIARLLGETSPAGLVFDPMWDAMPDADWSTYSRKLAFADGKRAADVIDLFGAPTWIFTWDLVTSRCTGQHRPLKRGKLCLWYGDVEEFDLDGAHYGEPGEPDTVTSQWGTYDYNPDPRGKHLSDVFQLSLPRFHSQTLHQYEKPLDWIRMLIGDCFPDGAVLDPFLGSGATLIACEQLGRPCYGAEIEPKYVAYTLERAAQTGATVTLIA